MALDVILNVYALEKDGTGKFLSRVGLGLWHSGVEVNGKEYFFSQGLLHHN
jgi:hypothetical protein